MKQGTFKHFVLALAQAVVAVQIAGSCVPQNFVQDALQSIIAGRIIDVFAFILDQLFYRAGF